MKAMLVIKTRTGYAVAPYMGEVPHNFVETMSTANRIGDGYYPHTGVTDAMRDYFEPPNDADPVAPKSEEVTA